MSQPSTPSKDGTVKLYAGAVTRDDGLRYDYMVECRPIQGAVVWFACVRQNGEYRGSPHGILLELTLERVALEGTVRGLVEAAIRAGSDVFVE